MALHVHYKTFYVSQPFSAKQQRQIFHVSITDNIVKGERGMFFIRFYGQQKW